MIRILELTWLFMSVLGLSGIIYKVIKQDEEIGFFVIFTLIAVLMYFYRRRVRIGLDKTKAEDTSDKYH